MPAGLVTEGHQDFNQLSVSDVSAPLPAAAAAAVATTVAENKRHAYASPTLRGGDKTASSSIDTLEVAIEFVLALEHPCMAHIPYPADSAGPDPANHMMLVC